MDTLVGKKYIGIVEDNNDPKRLGRCRVRVPFSYNEIPTDGIPWASPYIEPNGKSFNVPAIGKVVNVIFSNGDLYMPYYYSAEKYNINLQDKLETISDDEYRNFTALLFDHRTRIYSDKEALTMDYLLNRVRIDKSSINLELSNNRGRVNLGTNNADQQAVLGNNFIMDWLFDFLKILAKPTSLVGNSGSPIVKPELDIHIQKYLANPKKFLSDYVYVADKIYDVERDSITSEIEHDDTLLVNPTDDNPDGVLIEDSKKLGKDIINLIKSDQKEIVDEFKSLNIDLSDTENDSITIKRNRKEKRRKKGLLKTTSSGGGSTNYNQNYGKYYSSNGSDNSEARTTNTHTAESTLTLQDKIDKIRDLLTESVYSEIRAILEEYNLTTDLRISHFVSQLMHESGSFKFNFENLNYNNNSLLKTFPKYFNADTARQYAKKPEQIASRVYGNRMGNNDEQSKEGWEYKGRGYIQLTGKNNYNDFSKYTSFDFLQFPDKITTAKYSLSSAAWFFIRNKIQLLADKGNDLDTIKEVTKRINGGYNGLDDRVSKFNLVYNRIMG